MIENEILIRMNNKYLKMVGEICKTGLTQNIGIMKIRDKANKAVLDNNEASNTKLKEQSKVVVDVTYDLAMNMSKGMSTLEYINEIYNAEYEIGGNFDLRQGNKTAALLKTILENVRMPESSINRVNGVKAAINANTDPFTPGNMPSLQQKDCLTEALYYLGRIYIRDFYDVSDLLGIKNTDVFSSNKKEEQPNEE